MNRRDMKVGIYIQHPHRQDAVRLIIKTKKHVFHSVWLSLRGNGLHTYHGIDKLEYARFEDTGWYILK